MSPRPERAPRGVALVEVMIAMVIMIVAMTGFIGAMNQAVTATSVGHRRTIEAMLRSGLLDRWAVTPRTAVADATATAAGAWFVDACYDGNAALLGRNDSIDLTFACGPEAAYRRWVRLTGQGDRTWTLSAYVERIDAGCTPETREASLGCVSADTLLTD